MQSSFDNQNFTINCDLLDSDNSQMECDTIMEHQPTSSKTVNARFTPVSHEEIEQRNQNVVPINTQKKIRWAIKILQDWQVIQTESPANKNLTAMNQEEMASVIEKFIFEIKKKNGDEYPPKTIYEIYSAINYYFVNDLKLGWSLFKDTAFHKVRKAVETRMKENARKGLTSGNNKSMYISKEIEEEMWVNGILGSETPSKLVNTLIYLIGLHFALRGGEELRRLRVGKFSQIRSSTDVEGRSCMIYKEDVSKARQGGMKSIGTPPKSVVVYHNEADHSKCLPCLWSKYTSLRPQETKTDALFLAPMNHGGDREKWYKDVPLGKNSLGNVVKVLMAGYDGRYTNHSLRRTAATRLFQSGVEDDLIRRHTGHKSNALYLYKEPSTKQIQNVSKLLYVENNSRTNVIDDSSRSLYNVSNNPNAEVEQDSLMEEQATSSEQRMIVEVVQEKDTMNVGVVNESNNSKQFGGEMECAKYPTERTVIELEKNGAKLRIFM